MENLKKKIPKTPLALCAPIGNLFYLILLPRSPLLLRLIKTEPPALRFQTSTARKEAPTTMNTKSYPTRTLIDLPKSQPENKTTIHPSP
jgi:hypothetical protein